MDRQTRDKQNMDKQDRDREIGWVEYREYVLKEG